MRGAGADSVETTPDLSGTRNIEFVWQIHPSHPSKKTARQQTRNPTAMNVPEFFYEVTDRMMSPVIHALVPRESIENRLHKECEYLGPDETQYLMRILVNVHDRASSMVSHLSLMVVISLFLLDPENPVHNHGIVGWIILLDAVVYVFLVLLTIRALRSIGLSQDYNTPEEYMQHRWNESVLKYSILQIVNSFTIVATMVLGLAVVLGWFSGLTIA